MSTSNTSRTAYVVQCVGWTFNDQWFYRDGMEDDVPLQVYLRRERAEAERQRLEKEAWAKCEPLEYGPDFAARSHLSEAEFIRHLEGIGLTPPRLESWGARNWSDWWGAVERRLTKEQREAIWSVMTRIHLYEIVEVELDN